MPKDLKKEKEIMNYIKRIEEIHKKRKVDYSSESDDIKHLLDHTKFLCTVCYSYREKKEKTEKRNHICIKCHNRIIELKKRFNLNKSRATSILCIGYKYKKDERIESFKRYLQESKEECPYNMVTGKIMSVDDKDSVIANYNGVEIKYTIEELETLKRIRLKRMDDEYNRIRLRHKRFEPCRKAESFEGLFFETKEEIENV